MPKVTLELIQELRKCTGVGMMDCKKALEEANGDMEKAIVLLRKKGAAVAAKRAGNEANQGLIHAYIHPGAQVGVLLEINCETDFVARTPDMERFAQDLCLQIAAFKPQCVESSHLDPQIVEKEKSIYAAQLAGKPAQVIDQIIEGKLAKFYSEVCLFNQPFIKNEKLTVHDVLKDVIAKMGEKIVIKRFTRYQIGQN